MMQKMEEVHISFAEDNPVYPILLLPKKTTSLETNCDISENIYISITITSLDTENNDVCIYSGLCNIKLVDGYKINVEAVDNREHVAPKPNTYDDTQNYPENNQSRVWIDPIRSPHVYNEYDKTDTEEFYSTGHNNNEKHISVEQHNTYITQNVYNFNEHLDTSSSDFENERSRSDDTMQSYSDSNFYSIEFECETCPPQLNADEYIHDREMKAREETRYVGFQSENSALKQLMSTNINSASKQRKTILFLGQDSHSGQTVQKISINDPSLECIGNGEIDHEVIIDDSLDEVPMKNPKRYQCDKCQQMFDQISTFRQHMVGTHRLDSLNKTSGDFDYVCSECGKCLKNQKKFEQHCIGHGDPDLECNKCHKVFSTKFTLRAHRKIHNRKYSCKYCIRSYSTADELRSHLVRAHCIFSCDVCSYSSNSHIEFAEHQAVCKCPVFMDRDVTDSFEYVCCESDATTPPPDDTALMMGHSTAVTMDQVQEADTVLAKVMSNKIFLLKTGKTKEDRRYKKVCDVCNKNFDRIGDLKRHLIEHIVKSTFAKTPVGSDGTLSILCGVCKAASFTRIDTYKAHLREHAKLTLYKCTFCDKCFSDSSNFSKHKKIHGSAYFQCDLCHRKFNSKKMITQHLEFHNATSPVSCQYCGKIFHFKSMLNKHIKCTHAKDIYSRYKCRFCVEYMKTLKDKWDHEWSVHNVRKVIIDCFLCGCKFRKYTELKRHCHDHHGMSVVPTKKEFMKEAKKL